MGDAWLISGLIEAQINTIDGVWKNLKAELLFLLCHSFLVSNISVWQNI
jgi:hypothetical protein